MAFIRSYSSQFRNHLMDEVGDPFSLRIPKKLRKLKLGRAIGRVARGALGVAGAVVPGLGTAMNVYQALARKHGIGVDDVMGFARSYGYDVGDPGPAKRRKVAGSGTKAKSAAKKQRRAERATKPKGKAHRPSGTKTGVDWGKLGEAAAAGIPIAGSAAQEALRQWNASHAGAGADGLDDALGAALGGKGARGFRLGGHRRTMNPANVKALRRSLRRVDGFEKLVKRVEKLFPKMRRAHHAGASCSCRGRGRGKRAA